MQKIGDFWIPDGDARPGANLEKSKRSFEYNEGVQIGHLKRALELVPKFDIAVDGGANVGSWTRLMAKLFSEVHSFEPNACAYECLERNVHEWGISPIVRTYPNGLSDQDECVSIVTPQDARTVTSFVGGKGDVKCITIDSLELVGCSFIKLDVEGYEAKVLNGAYKTIKAFRPWIMIENKHQQNARYGEPDAPEKLLAKFEYILVEKIGDRQIDWLFKPVGE
ncbi:FkbM family methyltransferase [Rhizobiales bacterium]|uniref:FkbM family methyltransferase n=1 Tax=Hongsoonwoonella zoysiae TaxID=2821844 RepID=UPI0015619399|nr:FkbM family methyltransferase [Hongsoonwoonella zoysiae]NRG18268.1 FkbM family methyltransferase [Hongsoonwoonella zoysiae]